MSRRLTSRSRISKPTFRPWLETLESRWVLSAVIERGVIVIPVTTSAVRSLTDFTTSTLAPGDDNSTDTAVSLGFSANFFGNTRNQVYVNNNGNITFDQALASYNPLPLSSGLTKVIAPFMADVDTFAPNGSGTVTYGTGTVKGHNAFAVTWNDVTPFADSRQTRTDTFQAVLIDRSDIATGDFDLEFNYNHVKWDTGAASSVSARAGFSDGRTPANSFELLGSATSGAFLDTNSVTGLSNTSLNSDVVGRHVFFAREGVVAPNLPPVLDPIAPQQTKEGQALTFTAVARDPNPVSFYLVGAPAGANIDPTSGVFQWTPSVNQPAGPYSFIVGVKEMGTPVVSASKPVQVTVLDVTPQITLKLDRPALAGSPYSATGSFTDAVVGGQWSATVDYGDGSGAQTLNLVSTDQQTYTFTLQHTFATDSIASVKVSITDPDGSSAATGKVFVLPASAGNSEYKITSVAPGKDAKSTVGNSQQGVQGSINYSRSPTDTTGTTTSFVLFGDKPVDTARTGKFFDIKVADPQTADGLTLTITSDLLKSHYEFGYFKPGTNVWVSLLNRPDLAGVTIDPLTGTLTANLKVGPNGVPLANTVFAITLPAPTTTTTTAAIQPPLVQAGTTNSGVGTDASLGLALSVTFSSSTQLSVPLTASQNGQLAVTGTSQGAVTGSLRGSSFNTTRSGSNQDQTSEDGEAAFWRWLQSDENGQLLVPTDPPQPLPRKGEESSSALTEPVGREAESMPETPLTQEGELPATHPTEERSVWMWLGLLPGLMFRSAARQTRFTSRKRKRRTLEASAIYELEA